MTDQQNSDTTTQNIAQAIQEVSERATLLVREEIELAKAEVTEKVTKLIKGAVVGIAAGIFVVFGLVFLLHGFAWLAWYELFPDNQFFWGFFVVAAVLFLLGALAGFIAARALQVRRAADAADGHRRGQAHQGDRPVLAPGADRLAMPTRTPEEIRASIEANRMELAHSLTRLRGEVAEITDWRKQIAQHQKQVLIGAAVAGFVIGGGIAAVGGLFRRRRR